MTFDDEHLNQMRAAQYLAFYPPSNALGSDKAFLFAAYQAGCTHDGYAATLIDRAPGPQAFHFIHPTLLHPLRYELANILDAMQTGPGRCAHPESVTHDPDGSTYCKACAAPLTPPVAEWKRQALEGEPTPSPRFIVSVQHGEHASIFHVVDTIDGDTDIVKSYSTEDHGAYWPRQYADELAARLNAGTYTLDSLRRDDIQYARLRSRPQEPAPHAPNGWTVADTSIATQDAGAYDGEPERLAAVEEQARQAYADQCDVFNVAPASCTCKRFPGFTPGPRHEATCELYVSPHATMDLDMEAGLYFVTDADGVVFARDSSERVAWEMAESEGYQVSWRERV